MGHEEREANQKVIKPMIGRLYDGIMVKFEFHLSMEIPIEQHIGYNYYLDIYKNTWKITRQKPENQKFDMTIKPLNRDGFISTCSFWLPDERIYRKAFRILNI